MINVVLVEPEIPPNTGNVIRLCANTGAALHLVGPLGFVLDNSRMRRAGLDYHEFTAMTVYERWSDFNAQLSDDARLFAMTTKGQCNPFECEFKAGDWLIFGSETRGLAPEIMAQIDPSRRMRIPMRPNNRSLNLSNAVAITVYEAWRQLQFDGAS